MNYNSSKWYYSTWFIIVMFIACWPVGIALLILRNTGNKSAIFLGTTNKKKYVAGGIGLILIGVCCIGSSTVWGLLMIAGGAAMLYYSKSLADKANRNRKYIDLIINQHEGSIDNIASVCSIPYEKCVKELKYLQTVNVLNNVSIDEIGRTVSLIQPEPILDRAISMVPTGQAATKVTCTCPGCGAKVAVFKGTSINCEYCDSPITG